MYCLLDGLIRPGGRIQFSESLAGTLADLFAAAERMELEGIVCKRRSPPYVSGDTSQWLKIKCWLEILNAESWYSCLPLAEGLA